MLRIATEELRYGVPGTEVSPELLGVPGTAHPFPALKGVLSITFPLGDWSNPKAAHHHLG